MMVRPAKGIHIVVAKDRIRIEVRADPADEKSVLFVLPWGEHWIIGTTDTDWAFDLDHPAANSADIEYLLDQVNGVLDRP